MKKNVFYAVVAMCIVAFLFSFTLLSKSHIHKTNKLNSCGADAINLHIASRSGGYITFGWDPVNSPDHYNYGGYYQSGGNFSGTTYVNSVTIRDNGPGRFGLSAFCSDGSSGSPNGSPNILY